MKLFTSKRCYNGGDKHNFEAIYSEKPSNLGEFEGRLSVAALKAIMYHKVYKGSVCKWCGKVVNEQE